MQFWPDRVRTEDIMEEWRRELERHVDQLIAGFGGKLALYVKDLNTGEVLERDADAVFPTASCIKVFVLLELMRRVAAGDLTLQQTTPILPEQQVGGSGVLKDLTAGTMLPLRDVATLMIVLSDNTATNMLIDLLGLEAVNATIRNLGLQHTRLVNKVDFEAIDGDVTRFGVSTAREFARALEQVAQGAFINRSVCDTIIEIMERQQYLDLLPRYLPYNPYARELKLPTGLRIANKTGFFSGIRCDTALLFLPRSTLIVVALSKDCPDQSFNPENEGAVLLGRIGRVIYDHFAERSGGEGVTPATA